MKTILLGIAFAIPCAAQTLPFHFVNNSEYGDDQVYIAIIGEAGGGHVWLDPRTGTVHQMSQSDNTISGPTNGGDLGPGGNGKYADCFAPLSEIPSGTISVPQIAGSRILVSFQSQLYLYFFGFSGDPSGYAAPNLANPNDPNQGIRYELIELTYNSGGLWANTSRVDSYQYPMGLEVHGDNGFYRKVGELLLHQEILNAWDQEVSSTFRNGHDATLGIIHAPSKTAAFQSGGAQENFFAGYVDAIWSKYQSEDLCFNSGAAGIWCGRVSGEQFVFHNTTNFTGNATAYITRRPNTQEVLEGKGVLAEDVQKLSTQKLDLVVQAQMCAAINRHAVDLSASGTTQDWSDSSKYYKTWPYNEYAKFWHKANISNAQSAYGFCYDDVFDYSSTIHTPTPTQVDVSIGGFYNSATPICRASLQPASPSFSTRNYDLLGRPQPALRAVAR